MGNEGEHLDRVMISDRDVTRILEGRDGHEQAVYPAAGQRRFHLAIDALDTVVAVPPLVAQVETSARRSLSTAQKMLIRLVPYSILPTFFRSRPATSRETSFPKV